MEKYKRERDVYIVKNEVASQVESRSSVYGQNFPSFTLALGCRQEGSWSSGK